MTPTQTSDFPPTTPANLPSFTHHARNPDSMNGTTRLYLMLVVGTAIYFLVICRLPLPDETHKPNTNGPVHLELRPPLLLPPLPSHPFEARNLHHVVTPPSSASSFSSSTSNKNLVVVVALGANSSTAVVEHNVQSHFGDWDCIVFYHVDERQKPDLENTHCSIVRLPGNQWTHFLIGALPQELTKAYHHICILLDDVYLPVEGSSAIDIDRLVEQMHQHNLTSISPAIKGAVWWSTKPRFKTPQQCLWRTPTIETFVQIFDRNAFDCWREQLEYTNPLAVCVDLCLTKLCPETRLAVDSRMVAYHVGYKDLTIPSDALPAAASSSLSSSSAAAALRAELTRMKRPRPGGAPNMTLCERLGCNMDGQTNRRESLKESLDCNDYTVSGRVRGPSASMSRQQQSSKHDPSSPRNLVVVTALGGTASVPLVNHNINVHFSDWDCLIYVYVNEDIVPNSDLQTHCSIVRVPNTMWGHFLMHLVPQLTKPYQHIAVLLDDVFIPNRGGHAVNMARLIAQMKQYGVTSISPAIRGSFWPTTSPSKVQECLWRTPTIETFVQVFTRPVFDCWRNLLQFSNPQGFCLDMCLTAACSDAKLAVDSRMIAYHLGKTHQSITIPQDALPLQPMDGTVISTSFNLSSALTNAKVGRERPKAALDKTVCNLYECVKQDKAEMRRLSSEESFEC